MDIKLNMPPGLKSFEDVYSFLFQLTQTLNAAGNAIQTQTDAQIQSAVQAAGNATQAEAGKKAAALRELIVNTAEVVRNEMDALSVNLNSRLTAVSSRYGSLEQTVNSRIEATASAIRQEIEFDSRIAAVQSQTAGFSEYRTRMEGFIRSGIIGNDASGNPVIGIAIGQNLTNATKVTSGGVEYIDVSDQTCAFYTSQKVSFLINGNEVAYFSNQALHCGNLEISGNVSLGGRWELRNGAHLSLKWIGETT